ncbi:MAG: MFS transporter [Pseudomonadota bacterium]
MKVTGKSTAGYTLFLLFLINFFNFFDRAIPSVVLEPLRKEFSLTDTDLGVLTTAFILVYAFAGIPLGRLSDRFSRKRILAGGVAVWSVLTAASGMAWNFASFFAARMGVGVGEASCSPAANAMIGDLYPAAKRARAIGIFMLGLPLGSLACFALVGLIAQQYGWRAPFLLAAIPGLILAVLLWRLQEPERGAQESYKIDQATPIERPYRKILSVPTFWWIILSGASYNFASYAINTFLAAMLSRHHGLNIAEAGGIVAIVVGATGIISLTAGGWLADAVHRVRANGRLLLGAICLLVAAPLVWLGLQQPVGQIVTLTLLLSAGWLLFYMYYVTVYSSLQDVVEPRLRATAMAVYFFFMYVLGGGLGAYVTGVLSDFYAHQMMASAGASEITATFRALGLQASLSTAVPIAIFVTGVALCAAARTFTQDAKKNERGS